ncbi:heparan-alpha-glucosaminide N-acetyltransferase [Szabonella alba]|uniref:DUF1624 domain-containing protein n=1 Tax=Szabonella alba TaxID=2804194 RepID=A0A8K0V601_9RHOB|nr:heparan-alpha-glucosaminide N-acetyltransferase [Szabonella alba]MBL4915806.1 DUF1624 domain-containing protein [Szabonella alba]
MNDPTLTPPFSPLARSPVLDLARGLAVLAMISFHFCFDLVIFGHLPPEAVQTGILPLYARLIAGTFLFLSGVSFWLAHGAVLRPAAFARRLAVIVAAAAVVSLGTRLAMPDIWVRFGILHMIAAGSLLALVLRPLPGPGLLLLAAALFAAPWWLTSPALSAPWLLWLGLGEANPPMMDYTPVLPWAAPVLAGMALAKLGQGRGWWQRLLHPAGLPGGGVLQWAGRHSLPIYLLHQPVLLALFWVATALIG